jgi:hypothetical protein
VRLRQFGSQPSFAPVGLLVPQGDHLRDHGGCRPVGVVRCLAGKLLQGGGAPRQEARLPLREGPSSDVGHLTGVRDVAGRLPGLE